jgi:hypothetical protein
MFKTPLLWAVSALSLLTCRVGSGLGAGAFECCDASCRRSLSTKSGVQLDMVGARMERALDAASPALWTGSVRRCLLVATCRRTVELEYECKRSLWRVALAPAAVRAKGRAIQSGSRCGWRCGRRGRHAGGLTISGGSRVPSMASMPRAAAFLTTWVRCEWGGSSLLPWPTRVEVGCSLRGKLRRRCRDGGQGSKRGS